MLISADEFNFNVPTGFQDVTNYTFRTPEDTEELLVTCAEPDDDERNIQTAMAALRSRMERLFGDDLATESEGSVTLDGRVARQWIFVCKNESTEPRRGQAVIGEVPPGLQLRILYTSLAAVTDAKAKLSIMLQSLTVSEKPKAETVPTGYVRRQASNVWLDVPGTLLPPRTYVFLSEDESIRIELVLRYDPLTPEADFAKTGVNSIVAVEHVPVLLNLPDAESRSVRRVIEDTRVAGVSHRSAYQVQLRFANDTWASTTGYASQESATQMEDTVNALAVSLRYIGEKHV